MWQLINKQYLYYFYISTLTQEVESVLGLFSSGSTETLFYFILLKKLNSINILNLFFFFLLAVVLIVFHKAEAISVWTVSSLTYWSNFAWMSQSAPPPPRSLWHRGMRIKCLCGNELYFAGVPATDSAVATSGCCLDSLAHKKRESGSRCLTSSAGVKNAAHWRGDKIPATSWSLLPPFEVGPAEMCGHGGSPRNHRVPPLLSQTGLTWRVTPEFTFSETPARPKETESMQLKLLAGHKRGGSSRPLSVCLCSQCCLLMTQ